MKKSPFLGRVLGSALILQFSVFPAMVYAQEAVKQATAQQGDQAVQGLLAYVQGLEKAGWKFESADGQSLNSTGLLLSAGAPFFIVPPSSKTHAPLKFKVASRNGKENMQIAIAAYRAHDIKSPLKSTLISLPKNITTEAEAIAVKKRIAVEAKAFEAEVNAVFAKNGVKEATRLPAGTDMVIVTVMRLGLPLAILGLILYKTAPKQGPWKVLGKIGEVIGTAGIALAVVHLLMAPGDSPVVDVASDVINAGSGPRN